MAPIKKLLSVLALALVVAAPPALAKDELVVVAGATGRTGKHVVEQLLAKEYRVRALVRDAGKAKAELPAGVDVAVADVRDAKSLEAPLRGAKYLVSAIGAGGGPRPQPGNGPREVDLEGVRNLAEAAKRAKIEHFVLVSSAATTKAASYPMEFMRPILAAKYEGEQALRASGVPYTIVKPGGLLDEAGGRTAVSFAQGDQATGRIPRADVASVCVAVLGSEAARGKTFEVYSGQGAWNAAQWNAQLAGLAADGK